MSGYSFVALPTMSFEDTVVDVHPHGIANTERTVVLRLGDASVYLTTEATRSLRDKLGEALVALDAHTAGAAVEAVES